MTSEPNETDEQEDDGYPPETHKLLSWSAIQFIHRPTWRPLAWITYALAVLMAGGAAGASMMGLTTRVPGSGEIVAHPGVLQVLAFSRLSGRSPLPAPCVTTP